MDQFNKFRKENESLYKGLIVLSFIIGLWPVGIFLLIAGTLSDERDDGSAEHPYAPDYEKTAGGGRTWNPGARTASGSQTMSQKDTERPAGQKSGQRKTAGARRRRGPSKWKGLFSMVLGGIGTAVFGVLALENLFRWIPGSPWQAFRSSYIFFLLMAVSFAAFLIGRSNNKKAKRQRTYLAIFQGQHFIDIRELAKTCSVPVRTARNDVKDMLENGMLGTGPWFDHTTGYLILTSKGRQDVETMKAAAKAGREKAAESSSQGNRGAKTAEESQREKDERILAEIRLLNDQIEHEGVSSQIDRIERSARRIFEHRQNFPEAEKELRSFLDYYLPTTLKMLRKYSDLEEQGIQGDNIRTTMEKIETALDNVAAGFEKQLDNLYQSDMFDITSDIAAMEQMMAREGLSDNGGLRL